MTNDQDKINRLIERLDFLMKRQDDFSREISTLKDEIDQLKAAEGKSFRQESPIAESAFKTQKEEPTDKGELPHQKARPQQAKQAKPKLKSDLEKFIGENLINKIGIVITVLGVAIGAKYAIEHQLISPLTRIILGYLLGMGLLGFAFKLKKNYENFSAVLLSGGMAIMYFITYAAYSFYELIPQLTAFLLMLAFTAFTVYAAIKYNKQVIAHIGLVGAYAVPFLLSDGSGKVAVLFSYTAIINIGILIIAFKKYWKSLYYSAFGLTWLIYFAWHTSSYQASEHFSLAFVFLSLFFVIFYITFLAYKLIQSEKFDTDDIILLLANSFIFYAIGYNLLDTHETGSQLLGLFTLINAIIHFIVSAILYRQKLADRNLFYLIAGLVLVFITIAIPVQLDGNWVTLLWVGEAALLFWIGRTKNISFYEKLSYPLMLLAFFSILHDWSTVYNTYSPYEVENRMTPLLNINFLTSMLFVAAFGYINLLNQKKKDTAAFSSRTGVSEIINFSIPAIFLFALYYSFLIEINTYWSQLYLDSAITIESESQLSPRTYRNVDFKLFNSIWAINYSLLFFSLLALVNFKKIKDPLLGRISLGLIAISTAAFLTQGLYDLSELRESYLDSSEYYQTSIFHLLIRYISFAFVALALLSCFNYLRQDYLTKKIKKSFDLLFHLTLVWIASSELINWMDIADFSQSYKLGLSILWGVYALLLIAFGIWKKRKYLRIGAIVLFGGTLIKLFLYDISHLDTIAKTIVFVSLGILLLIISFLYNKYKLIISDESEN